MIVFCDGASNPKSKRSGVGAVWFENSCFEDSSDGRTLMKTAKPIHELSREIWGSETKYTYPTNNEAEYESLIAVLEFSIEHGYKFVEIYMDSKLVVNQVNGKWKINFPHLQKLKNKVDALRGEIAFSLKHIRREFNTHADIQSKISIISIISIISNISNISNISKTDINT